MSIKPNDLIALFQQALDEKWGYIYGSSGETWTQAKQDAATREQTVKWGQQWVGRRVSDCSGLFYWAFKQLGGYIYHGSNTMYLKYSNDKGALTNGMRSDGKELLPASAVYKYSEEDGYHHVGLYIGNNTVIEAKGTYYGVVTSDVSTWDHWSELQGVDYYSGEVENTEKVLYQAVVTTPSGSLNVRKGAGVSYSVIGRIAQGAAVNVLQEGDGWVYVQNGSLKGWCCVSFLTKAGQVLITDSAGNTFTPVGEFTVKVVEANA